MFYIFIHIIHAQIKDMRREGEGSGSSTPEKFRLLKIYIVK